MLRLPIFGRNVTHTTNVSTATSEEDFQFWLCFGRGRPDVPLKWNRTRTGDAQGQEKEIAG